MSALNSEFPDKEQRAAVCYKQFRERKHADDATTMTVPSPIAFSPTVAKQSNGKWSVLGVPIFETHENRGYKCDATWMARCVATQRDEKAKKFLPRLIVGHNPDDGHAAEKPAAAFLDNYRFDAGKGWLYADYVDVDESLLTELKANKWPGRSVEVIPDQAAIRVVALLGGTPPYFKLPDTRFQDHGKPIYYAQETKYMDTGNPGGPGGSAGQSTANVEDQDYMKLCKLMDRYWAEHPDVAGKLHEKHEAGETEEEESDEHGGDNSNPKPKTGKDQKMADDAKTIKYDEQIAKLTAENADLQGKVAKYQETIAGQNDRLAKLETANEIAKWTAFYQDAHIPAGRLDIPKEVEFTMELPADKRQSYAERTVKRFNRPPSNPDTNRLDTAAAPVEGSAAERSAILSYYEKNKTKYRGDLMAAARDWRADQVAKPIAKS